MQIVCVQLSSIILAILCRNCLMGNSLQRGLRPLVVRNQEIRKSSKMVVHHVLNGFDEFDKFAQALPADPKDPYFFLFTGSLTENGKSWCPSCVTADPVLEKMFDDASENTNFVKVFVGSREYWKDSNCPFRKDPRTKLLVIPTLFKWKGPQRLQGDQCSKEELVEMMFDE